MEKRRTMEGVQCVDFVQTKRNVNCGPNWKCLDTYWKIYDGSDEGRMAKLCCWRLSGYTKTPEHAQMDATNANCTRFSALVPLSLHASAKERKKDEDKGEELSSGGRNSSTHPLDFCVCLQPRLTTRQLFQGRPLSTQKPSK
jgi:hypothetical protein